MSLSNSIIADPELVPSGERKIKWAKDHMPIMNRILESYADTTLPLKNLVIVTSVHMEAKTACLVRALAKLGALVIATGCNPLSTQDDVAAALATTKNVTVYAKHGCHDEYWSYLERALIKRPHVIIDDGGDLVELLHSRCSKYTEHLIGGCEETTTGVRRLKALETQGKLAFPMIDVNDANCKHLFDNYYGTGQSVLDGITRTTNLVIAGKTAVVAGYGDCGSGIAKRLRGQDAKVIITEVNPIKALKAHMDGYTVMTMDEAAPLGDIFITATGCENVIIRKHFKTMKDGAILANAGHFNVEINAKSLAEMSISHFEARTNIESFTLPDGKTLDLLAEGRLVNLAAGDGHPVEIMDMSFSLQLLSVLHIVSNFTTTINGRLAKNSDIAPKVYSVPADVDDEVARIALSSNHIRIDKLTKSQRIYLENGF